MGVIILAGGFDLLLLVEACATIMIMSASLGLLRRMQCPSPGEFDSRSGTYRLTPWVPNNQNAEVSHNTIRMANSTPPAMGSAQPG
jgi:hypothetical protein